VIFSVLLFYVVMGDPIFVVEKEPNEIGAPNGPYLAPVRIEGHIYPALDEDSFAIIIPTTGAWEFKTYSGGCTKECVADTEIELWYNGSMLYRNDDVDGGEHYCSHLNVSLSANTYILKVKTFLATSAASYAISIKRDDDETWNGLCFNEHFWSSTFSTKDYGVAPVRFETEIIGDAGIGIFRVYVPYSAQWNIETFAGDCSVTRCARDTFVAVWDERGVIYHRSDVLTRNHCHKVGLDLDVGIYIIGVYTFSSHFDLVLRPSGSSWDGSCVGLEAMGEIYYEYAVEEVHTGYDKKNGLYWQSHIIDRDKGFSIHLSEDGLKSFVTITETTPPDGTSYYWSLVSNPVSKNTGLFAAYSGANSWELFSWDANTHLVERVWTSEPIATGNSNITASWGNPHMTITENNVLHVTWSRELTDRHLEKNTVTTMDFVGKLVGGKWAISAPKYVDSEASSNEGYSTYHSNIANCDASYSHITLIAWHSILNGDPSTSTIRLAKYDDASSSWTQISSPYVVYGSELELVLECNDNKAVVAFCVAGDDSSTVCALHVIWQLLTPTAGEQKWNEVNTGFGIPTRDVETLALGHTEEWMFLAWVTESQQISFSWASTEDISKWEKPFIVDEQRGTGLVARGPSFACSYKECYLTYLAGNQLARTVLFVSCPGTAGKPCINNGKTILHPIEPGPVPVPSLPPPPSPTPPTNNTGTTNTEEWIYLAAIVGAVVLLAFVFGLTLCLMARNQSGCFAPMKYKEAPQEEERVSSTTTGGGRGDGDVEVELESGSA